MITRETIENIISSARIEEVVGDFVSLKRRGVNMIGLCPFHNEKTPSFTVSPTKGIYKCFGCGKAGNSVNFIMEHEHFTYPEALRFLARKYNIEIEEEEKSPELQQEINEKESLFNLNQFALSWFAQSLFESEEGKAVGLSYFRERGIRDDIVRKFQLGYSPEQWDAFTRHALSQGYKEEYLVKSGLSIAKENRLYDRFHHRVIFPIHSASGRILGFGGRILTSDKNRPKYVNSPESDIYNKSRTLYGIYLAKNSIVSKDNCLLVEGYTDVISLYQAGIENVVASSGTSLTQDQIRLIRRYTNNITILYDGDPAGIKASLRGIDMIVEGGMNVRIVLFPDGEDPDSYSRKHHPADVEKFIADNSVNFILFKTKLLLAETQGDPIKKSALIKEIVSTISLIPDGITRTLYVRECSSMMQVPEQVLVNEINKILRNRIAKQVTESGRPEEAGIEEPAPVAPQQVAYDPDSDERQEREILRLLLLFGSEDLVFQQKDDKGEDREVRIRVADFILQDILRDELVFDDEILGKIFQEFARGMEEEKMPDRMVFLTHPDSEIQRTAIDLVFTPHELSPNWEKNNIYVPTEEQKKQGIITTALYAFKSKKIEKMLREIQHKMASVTTPEEASALQKEYIELKKTSNYIHAQLLGRTIIR